MWFFQDKLIDVRIFTCENGNCYDKMSYNTHAVYLPTYNASSWKPIFLDSIFDINMLIEKLLDQLPCPQELSDNDFEVNKMLIHYILALLLFILYTLIICIYYFTLIIYIYIYIIYIMYIYIYIYIYITVYIIYYIYCTVNAYTN